jgi:hypothetical protein
MRIGALPLALGLEAGDDAATSADVIGNTAHDRKSPAPQAYGKAGRHSWESSLQRTEPKPTKAFAGALIRREGTPATHFLLFHETCLLGNHCRSLGPCFWRTHTYPPLLFLLSEQGERHIIQLNNTSQ